MAIFEFLVRKQLRHVRADGRRTEGAEVVFYDEDVDATTGQRGREVARFTIPNPRASITRLGS